MANSSAQILHEPVELSEIEKSLINRLQQDLPLCSSPFAIIGEELDLPEVLVVEILQNLLERGVITRFGPLFDITKNKGVFSLCALKVPEQRIESVAEVVNSFKEVAHNYLRENEWNMWFVLATKEQAALDEVFNEIINVTKCPGINCPKEKEFFVGLNLFV